MHRFSGLRVFLLDSLWNAQHQNGSACIFSAAHAQNFATSNINCLVENCEFLSGLYPYIRTSILIHCLFLYELPCCFQSVKAALSPCYFCKDINHPSGLLFCALLICTAFGKLWWKFVMHPGPTYVLCEGELACKKWCLKYSRGLIGYS